MKKVLLSAIMTVGMISVIYFNLHNETRQETASYIVMADSLETAQTSVLSQKATVTRTLDIINGVAANLTSNQVENLRDQGLNVSLDASFTLNRRESWRHMAQVTQSVVPFQMGALPLHDAGWLGDGVTIAVMDTGMQDIKGINKAANNRNRYYGTYDATLGYVVRNDDDTNGH